MTHACQIQYTYSLNTHKPENIFFIHFWNIDLFSPCSSTINRKCVRLESAIIHQGTASFANCKWHVLFWPRYYRTMMMMIIAIKAHLRKLLMIIYYDAFLKCTFRLFKWEGPFPVSNKNMSNARAWNEKTFYESK